MTNQSDSAKLREDAAKLIHELREWSAECGDDDRSSAALLCQAANWIEQSANEKGKPVAKLSIRGFRGRDSMLNRDLQLYEDLPDGDYSFYLRPPASEPSVDERAKVTVEMVRVAHAAYFAAPTHRDMGFSKMRAALEAALALPKD